MLSEKPWRLEAMARLFLSVVLCVFLGSMILTVMGQLKTAAKFNWKMVALATIAMAFLGGALVLVRRHWELETYRRRAVALLTLIYAGMLFGWLIESRAGSAPDVNSTASTVIRVLSFQGAALVWISFFVREHGTSWTEAFGLSHKRSHAILIGIAVACFFLPVAGVLQAGSLKLIAFLTHLTGTPFKAEDQVAVQALKHAYSWGGFAALAIETVLLVPVAEEVLFRGVLYRAIRQTGHARLALWTSALLFGAIHMDAERFLPLFVFGVLLALLYEKTSNLLTSITAHALFNLAGVIQVFLIERSMNS